MGHLGLCTVTRFYKYGLKRVELRVENVLSLKGRINMKRDTQKFIDYAKRKHNTHYDMNTNDIKYIIEKYEGINLYTRLFYTICDAFYFGYEMGRRATLKEIKK